MRTFEEAFWGYREDPVKYFKFDRFADEAGDFRLVAGFINFKCLDNIAGEKIVFLCFEEPNGFFAPERFLCHGHLHLIHKIFTVCPFTAEWSNKQFNTNKWEASFIPFNETMIPPKAEKKFDIAYAGSWRWGLSEVGQVMKRFNSCFMSFNSNSYTTHVGVTYPKKLKLFSQSRISIVHNLLFVEQVYAKGMRRDHQNIIKSNKAFSQIADLSNSSPLAPQLKTRLFEAAFCRSLILCRRDPWNLIERFFTPGKEFVYYDEGSLHKTVNDILSNYDKYIPIVENAFERAVNNYTTRHYFDKNLKNI
jgi:hypothetical protein